MLSTESIVLLQEHLAQSHANPLFNKIKELFSIRKTDLPWDEYHEIKKQFFKIMTDSSAHMLEKANAVFGEKSNYLSNNLPNYQLVTELVRVRSNVDLPYLKDNTIEAIKEISEEIASNENNSLLKGFLRKLLHNDLRAIVFYLVAEGQLEDSCYIYEELKDSDYMVCVAAGLVAPVLMAFELNPELIESPFVQNNLFLLEKLHEGANKHGLRLTGLATYKAIAKLKAEFSKEFISVCSGQLQVCEVMDFIRINPPSVLNSFRIKIELSKTIKGKPKTITKLVSLLPEAVRHGQLVLVKELISKGVDIHSRDEDGNTALSLAIEYAYKDKPLFKEIVTYLTDHGAIFSSSNKYKNTALHQAAFNDTTELLKPYWNDLINLSSVVNQRKETPLDLAIKSKHPEAIQFFQKLEKAASQQLTRSMPNLPSFFGKNMSAQQGINSATHQNTEHQSEQSSVGMSMSNQ